MENQFYVTFHIAGFTYWDRLDIFDALKIGTEKAINLEFMSLIVSFGFR
jgi:hypothetical protein